VLPGDELTALVDHVDDLRGRVLRWLSITATDVLVCPALPTPAVLHGEGIDPDFADSYSNVHNITGWPSVVVRGGTAPGGLPIGVQVVARQWRDDVALAVAQHLEEVFGGWQPTDL